MPVLELQNDIITARYEFIGHGKIYHLSVCVVGWLEGVLKALHSVLNSRKPQWPTKLERSNYIKNKKNIKKLIFLGYERAFIIPVYCLTYF